jgi:LPS sulfotransferase NodH
VSLLQLRDKPLRPTLSYTIWFSQRTGSTLLCKTLEETGIAGKPNEWLNIPDGKDLLEYYSAKNYAELQQHLWELGSTPNHVFGMKFGFYQPYFNKLLEMFSNFPDAPRTVASPAGIWEHAFPNSRHIFMTRRNKVRLAVSWWKAIKTREWHREKDQSPNTSTDLAEAYSFDAIHHLLCECTMREAGIQEFFSGAGILPLTIVYEDFISDYDKSVRNVLEFLELASPALDIVPPHYTRLSDEISEQWTERFRNDLQKGWQNRGW